MELNNCKIRTYTLEENQKFIEYVKNKGIELRYSFEGSHVINMVNFHYIKDNILYSDYRSTSWTGNNTWAKFKEININELLNPIYEIY